jgi:acyl-CoA synthetase (AMP-forming)/AMP-acid ligase II
MSIYKSPYPSVAIPDESVFTFLFESKGSRFPGNAPAFIDGLSGRVVSRLELKKLALSLAWGTRNQFAALGGVPLTRGDTIMIFSPNSISWPIMLFASVAAGLKATLANSSYTPRELQHQYLDSGAKAVFVHPSLIPVVLAMFELIKVNSTEAKKRIIIADWNEKPSVHGYVRLDDLLGKGALKEEEKFYGSQTHETLYLCYSSGTTGLPKGVEVRVPFVYLTIL